ncbi:MAG: NAD(P)/FAD-dependent oxidoreductase [Gemmataceae bacterium]
MSRRVVVVGGGVIGAACAHFLSKSGWAVTVLDAGEFGRGCSHANCGYVCPSHVLPLAGPGAIRTALRAIVQPNGPLKIKPRFDPALWSWLFHFAKRCNVHDMLAAGRGIQPLLNSSRSLYPQILDEEKIDCEWETRGLLFVFQTKPAFGHYAETNRLLSEQFNMPAKRFDGDAVSALEPALKPGLAGGWLYEGDAHLRPDRLMSGWKAALLARGVTIRENCVVESLTREQGRAKAVVGSQGEIEAEAFVFAAGALSPMLAPALGCRLPIQPGKGYSITMDRPARCPTIPLIFEEHRVAVTPMQSGYRLGSTMEFAGYDATLNPKRLDLLREGAKPYLHEPLGETVREEWFGWRPMTSDGLPIIGPVPGLANAWVAAGHNMLGLSMAPATGKLVAELLDGRPPHVDASPYSVARF